MQYFIIPLPSKTDGNIESSQERCLIRLCCTRNACPCWCMSARHAMVRRIGHNRLCLLLSSDCNTRNCGTKYTFSSFSAGGFKKKYVRSNICFGSFYPIGKICNLKDEL